MMNVVSVNVSRAKEVPYLGRTVTTGIFKEPVRRRVMVRRCTSDGEDQADHRVHGVGFDMAIDVYPVAHDAFWARELGRDGFPYGQFGDNLTVEGLSEDGVWAGRCCRSPSRASRATSSPCEWKQVLASRRVSKRPVLACWKRARSTPVPSPFAESIRVSLSELHGPGASGACWRPGV